MRQCWIGTGWKMNHSLSEAESYALALREFDAGETSGLQVFVVPPFTALDRVCRLTSGSRIKVGAQNMHWEDRGAFTGEISPAMVKDCGAHLVELGHSERRAQFGETDFTVNKKVLAALRYGLRPLVCVGETATEREFGVARECVVRQTVIALRGVPSDRVGEVIFAYEPVWAIGESGTPAEPDYVNEVHGWIRAAISKVYGTETVQAISILYGGSVNGENAVSLTIQPEVDGLFIGRAAWQVSSFIDLIQQVQQAV